MISTSQFILRARVSRWMCAENSTRQHFSVMAEQKKENTQIILSKFNHIAAPTNPIQNHLIVHIPILQHFQSTMNEMMMEAPELIKNPMITFRPQSSYEGAELAEEWLQRMLEDDEWDIGVRRFEDFDRLQLLSNAESINVQSLKVRWAEKSGIIHSIKLISFPYLRELFLNGNCIRTIEPLAIMKMPNIEKVNLKQNLILSITPLRKCQITNLKELSIYFNVFLEMDSLSELNSPQLERTWLNGEKEDEHVNSLAWIAKMESKQLRKVLVSCDTRIDTHRARIWDTLEEKMTIKNLVWKYRMKDDHGINWL